MFSHKPLHSSFSNSEGSYIWSHSFVDFCWVRNGDKVLTVDQVNLKLTMEPRLTSNWQKPPSLSLLGTEIPGLILAHSFLWPPAGVTIYSRSCYTELTSRSPSAHIHWVISHLHHCCPRETSQSHHVMQGWSHQRPHENLIAIVRKAFTKKAFSTLIAPNVLTNFPGSQIVSSCCSESGAPCGRFTL